MPAAAIGLLMPRLAVDRTAGEPLHRQLYFAIRQAILAGRLRPGARLPATRTLAHELGISRNTVLVAFEQLHAEGYVDGRVGAGSFVSRHLPEAMPDPRAEEATAEPCGVPARGPARRGAELAALGAARPRAPRPFSPGLPELERFPFDDWARLLARRWRRPKRAFLVGGAPAGYLPLRQAIADHLAGARAVVGTAEQVIVVSGTQQALDLAARVLLDPGDAVWVEEPGYPPTAAVLTAAGARLVPVPVDGEGLSVVAGRAAEPAARLACVSPSHQYPLGVTMRLERRLELLAWARSADGFVFEDDYDSEFRYAGRPLAALQGLDRDGRVIYVGTLSKVMFPGLRIGYMVVPQHLIDAFLALRSLVDAHPPSVAQAALVDFIGEGHLAAHVRRMRVLYAERQAALIRLTHERLGARLQLSPSDAGMHLLGRVASGVDDTAIARAAARRGVDVAPLSALYREVPRGRGLLLGYAGVAEAEMASGLDRVAEAMVEVGRHPIDATTEWVGVRGLAEPARSQPNLSTAPEVARSSDPDGF
jgi:GntR family transcriptional regulator/MocR family aminotransferase